MSVRVVSQFVHTIMYFVYVHASRQLIIMPGEEQ